MLTLNYVLAISGKPGLYQLISRGNNMLIVESLDETKKRQPVYASDKVISLADIAMYTDTDEVPLTKVLTNVKEKENGEIAKINPKKASKNELSAYFAEVLPDYDRDRVYTNDIAKLIKWYNILIKAGITEFTDMRDEYREAAEKAQAEAEAKAAEETAPAEEKEAKPAKKAAAKKPAAKKTTKKADAETTEKKPAAKKTTAKKAATAKKPATKKTTKKTEE